MPFTPAHSAIVLPFIRMRWFSATALIIGSMAPDFEYFFKVSVDSEHSHTWLGVLYFDLPTVVVLSFAFHLLVKRNLIQNLPPFLQRRFQDTLRLDFVAYLKNSWHIFIWSALLGAASHIIWDGFTHYDGYFAQRLPFYDRYVPFRGVNYPMFYALQHISTAVGLTIVTLYILLKQSEPVDVMRPKLLYWTIVFLITASIVVARYAVDSWTPHIGNVVVSFISGLCLALILTGLFNFKNLTFSNRHGQEDAMGAGRKA